MKCSSTRALRRSSAFSLIEVLVAVVFTGIVVLSLYAGFSTGITLVQLSRDDLRATQIMVEKVESVRLCSWSQIQSLPMEFHEPFDPSRQGMPGIKDGYYGIIRANVPTDMPDYQTNMRVIQIMLTWTNYHGGLPVVRTRQMQTLVSRYGMQNYTWGGS